jgi:uncharacterized membrane protein YoaK (UPF0700 family)
MEKVMKRVSLAGVILGMVLGVIAGSLFGSWIFWLGAGLAIGVVVSAVQARRSLMHSARARQELNS